MNKTKLVQVIADSGIGGGPKHVLGLLTALDKSRFEAFLVCPLGPLSTEAAKIKGVSVINVPMKSKFDFISVFQLFRAFQRIESIGEPFGPMIIHTHGIRAGLLVNLTGFRSVTRIYTEHRFDADYHIKSRINEFLQLRFLRLICRKSDLVVAVSSSVKRFLLQRGIADREKVITIPNAIEAEETAGHKIKTPNQTPVIGTIGNLNIQKGQIYLVDAMPQVLAKYPLATLEIVGEGEERNNLVNRAKALGIERHISLLGQKKNAKKLLSGWDAFVLPSVAETFGIAILEAMQAGVPVVASKVGGIPDIIENRKNGLLVKVRDPKALAKAIIEILDHPVLAAKLKREGQKRVKDFAWPKIVAIMEKVYENLTDV